MTRRQKSRRIEIDNQHGIKVSTIEIDPAADFAPPRKRERIDVKQRFLFCRGSADSVSFAHHFRISLYFNYRLEKLLSTALATEFLFRVACTVVRVRMNPPHLYDSSDRSKSKEKRGLQKMSPLQVGKTFPIVVLDFGIVVWRARIFLPSLSASF
jgi:hypothetical protein